MTDVSLEQEKAHLLRLYDGDASQIMGAIERQLSILAGRAQTLLSLGAVTITVTGFSGAAIARTGKLAAILLVSGLVAVLVAAGISMTGILRLRWITQMPPCTLEEAVQTALEIRNAKTKAFDRSLGILVLGLTLYVSSIALLLLGNIPEHVP